MASFEDTGMDSEFEDDDQWDSATEETNSAFKKRKVTSTKRKAFTQTYRDAWEKEPLYKGWLTRVKSNPKKAFCKVCKKEMTAVITTIRKHQASASHQREVKRLDVPSSSRIDTILRQNHKGSDDVKEAELRLVSFISEHNLSFKIMDHFSDLLPLICPDSKIAAGVKCKRTKTKCLITNALAPHFHDNLVSDLKQAPFSIIIDETTDVSTRKELALVTRQYDSRTKTVKCSLYDLIEMTNCTAEALFQAIINSLSKDEIPVPNVIGFAADTTNVMFGQHNSVVSRLKERLPHIFILRCICHSAHLCASHACEKLPRTAEDLIHDIYNYFAHSAKRQADFERFQSFAEVEPHRLLRPCQTRWLSLHACVSSIIEQWEVLTHYFETVSSSDNLLSSQKILSQLRNPIWKLYFHFLDFVLPKFTGLNLMFQSSKPSLHCLNKGLTTTYKDLVCCFMSEAYWRHTSIGNIDPTSQPNHLPLTSMYMGAKIACLLMSADYQQVQRSADIKYFLSKVQEFYIEAALQIRKRFPIGDPLIEMFEILDPNTHNIHSKYPSLAPLAASFPNLIPVTELQLLDNEWRLLDIINLPFDHNDMDPEEYWGRVLEIENGVGEQQFKTLGTFMCNLLSLPHANVDVERIFSSVNLIKTRTRNTLKTKTVRALLISKDGIKNSGGCVGFNPPKELKQRMNSGIYQDENTSEVSEEEN